MSDEPLTIEINGEPVTADMQTWEQVSQTITARRVADRKAWEQKQREAGQVWYATYYRYHSRYEEECFSLRSAAAFLQSGEESGDLSPESIRCPDGSVIEGRDYEAFLAEPVTETENQ